MATWRITLLRCALLSSPPPPFFQSSSFSTPIQRSQLKRSLVKCSSLSKGEPTSSTRIQSEIPKGGRISSWKPMCLYHTQGKCTKMDDPLHLEKFSHSCSVELGGTVPGLKNSRAQKFDYFLVLDLEGKVEILEFPVLLFDAKTMDVVDVFHRFVRPTRMTEKRINEYIEGKYGRFGVDRVWHDTAIKFEDVIEQFESWLRKERDGHIRLWREDGDGHLNEAAFVTCGNWDLKTKIPQQCEVAGMKLPPYFMEWSNLKDIYLNFYNRRAPGMLSMMRELGIPQLGSHHLGIDDSKNIARVLQRLLTDGALVQITAKRSPGSPHIVRFLFQNRIK
ncbi:putative exonuclease [Handroanthus impetiginosus]|uniref:Putative exonuclease n=1 Tax=Handroanthus impetiginosus TaxID=429701 RepID=A0A2G9HDW1_9LAMI|nr:putative exonuclease [Handroanthus impetiginosus]